MKAWEAFLDAMEKELGKETVAKWLRPLKIVRFDACNLYLEASDSFKAIWFEEHVRHRARTRFLNNNHKPIKVHIAVATQTADKPRRRKRGKHSPLATPTFSLEFDELDAEATFENFITEESHLLAHKLLQESVHDQTPTFNPIYLFGRSGTGKTHLMMAVAKAFKEKGLNTLYVRANTFTEHVVSAIRTGEMQKFRKAYRKVDVLLVDDLEIFSRKGATQEEFFHTFNTLHVENKQIILSASSPPQELKHIEPRLVSRFEWGIVVPLQPLEKEGMARLLKQKSETLAFPLKEEVSAFLLETFGAHAQSLMKALDALVLRTHLNQGLGQPTPLPLPLEMAEKYLTDLVQEEEKALVTPGTIIRSVAEYYGIRMDDILSKSQSREVALPRQIAMHLCRERLKLPYMKIGDIFSRDHSTVMASVKQVQRGLEAKNHEITAPLKGILKSLGV